MSFNLNNVKQHKYSSNISSVANAYAKRVEDEEERKRQQQLIDAEYQKTLQENQKRGGFDRFVDGLSVAQYPMFGAIVEGADAFYEQDNPLLKPFSAIGGAMKGVGKGLASANPFGDDYTEGEYNFGDVLDSGALGNLSGYLNPLTAGTKISGLVGSLIDPTDENAIAKRDLGKRGSYSAWQPEGGFEKFQKGGIDFLGNAIVDPLNLVGGSALKMTARGTGKTLTREALEAVSKETIEKSFKGLDEKVVKHLSHDSSERFAKKINKLRGVQQTDNLTFMGKEIEGSGDMLRAFGDKTKIAPTINSGLELLGKTNVGGLFDTRKQLKELARTDVDGFVQRMAMQQNSNALGVLKQKVTARFIEGANKTLKKDDVDNKAIVDMIESGKLFDVKKEYQEVDPEHLEHYTKFINDRMQYAEGKGLTTTATRDALKELHKIGQEGGDIFERMRNPKMNPDGSASAEQVIYRTLLDPKGKWENLPYEAVYRNRMKEFVPTIVKQAQDDIVVKDITTALAKKKHHTPISSMQARTGMFVNTRNLTKYGVLLKQNVVLSSVLTQKPIQKVDYINKILFDGKQVITGSKFTTPSQAGKRLNDVLRMVANDASEGDILDYIAKHNMLDDADTYVDIVLDDKQIGEVLDALSSDEVTANAINKKYGITDALASQKQVRLFNKNTRQLVMDNTEGSVKWHADNVGKTPSAIMEELQKENTFDVIDAIRSGVSLEQTNKVELFENQKRFLLNDIEAELQRGMSEYNAKEMRLAPLSEENVAKFVNASDADLENMVQERVAKHTGGFENSRHKEKYTNKVRTNLYREKTLIEAYDAISRTGITSQETLQAIMRLDMFSDAKYVDEVASADGMRSLYTITRKSPDGTKVYNYTYDPYTGKTTGDQIAILEGIQEEARTSLTKQQSVIDDILKVSFHDKNLTRDFKEYMDDLGYQYKGDADWLVEAGQIKLARITDELNFNNVSLNKHTQEAIRYVIDAFKKMGGKERTAQKLSTMLNDYVPHILNPEIRNNPMLMDKLKREQPELFRQVLMYSGEKFNVHGVSRSTRLEERVKSVLMDKYEALGKDTSNITGKTIAEVNEVLNPLLKEAGFDGDFFINDMYEVFVQRAVQHGEVVYAENHVDTILKQFAKPVKSSNIILKDNYYVSQKDLKKVFDGLSTERQWMLLEEMGFDPTTRYNKMLVKVTGKQLHTMRQALEKINPDFNIVGHTLPEDISRHVNKIGHMQLLEDENMYLKTFDKFTNLWKQTATVINPGFHMRNRLSNMWQNYLAVGADVFNKDVRNVVKEVLGGKEGTLVTKSGQQFTYADLRAELLGRDILSRVDFDVAHQTNNVGKLFGDELNQGDGGLVQAGLTALSKHNEKIDPTMLNKIDPTDAGNFFGFKIGRKYGQKVEDFDRTLNFIANVRNDVGFDDAHEMVDKFLFDYSDLTPFESNIMKRMIPFYTWLRKNAPLQLEQMFEQPGRYARVLRATQQTQEQGDTTFLPEYMNDWVRLPISFGNTDWYANPSMPYQDLANVADMVGNMAQGDFKDVIGMLNPALKVLYELGRNHNTFYDAPIMTDEDKMVDQRNKYLQNALLGGWNTLGKTIGGVTGLADGDVKDFVEDTLSTGTGVRTKFHDVDKTKKDAIYRAIRKVEEDMKADTSKQRAFNQTFDEYRDTKLKQYGY